MDNIETQLPHKRVKNLVGQKFGRLTVEAFSGANKWGNALWKCRCECGNEKVAQSALLLSNQVGSCGCLAKAGHFKRQHSACYTPEYSAWNNIKGRTANPNHKSFKDYGARGIKMCEEWMNSFSAFLEHVGHRPSRNHSIDRIDNNLGYIPGNIRWSTRKEQQRNRRCTKNLTFNGETHCLAAWSEKTGISYDALCRRVRDGWSPERALTEKVVSQFNCDTT